MRAFVPILLLAAVACTPNDPTLGGAVRSAYAQQIINPDPVDPGPRAAQPGGDGAAAAAAVQRYRTDQVKKPVSVRTTNVGSGAPR